MFDVFRLRLKVSDLQSKIASSLRRDLSYESKVFTPIQKSILIG